MATKKSRKNTSESETKPDERPFVERLEAFVHDRVQHDDKSEAVQFLQEVAPLVRHCHDFDIKFNVDGTCQLTRPGTCWVPADRAFAGEPLTVQEWEKFNGMVREIEIFMHLDDHNALAVPELYQGAKGAWSDLKGFVYALNTDRVALENEVAHYREKSSAGQSTALALLDNRELWNQLETLATYIENHPPYSSDTVNVLRSAAGCIQRKADRAADVRRLEGELKVAQERLDEIIRQGIHLDSDGLVQTTGDVFVRPGAESEQGARYEKMGKKGVAYLMEEEGLAMPCLDDPDIGTGEAWGLKETWLDVLVRLCRDRRKTSDVRHSWDGTPIAEGVCGAHTFHEGKHHICIHELDHEGRHKCFPGGGHGGPGGGCNFEWHDAQTAGVSYHVMESMYRKEVYELEKTGIDFILATKDIREKVMAWRVNSLVGSKERTAFEWVHRELDALLSSRDLTDVLVKTLKTKTFLFVAVDPGDSSVGIDGWSDVVAFIVPAAVAKDTETELEETLAECAVSIFGEGRAYPYYIEAQARVGEMLMGARMEADDKAAKEWGVMEEARLLRTDEERKNEKLKKATALVIEHLQKTLTEPEGDDVNV